MVWVFKCQKEFRYTMKDFSVLILAYFATIYNLEVFWEFNQLYFNQTFHSKVFRIYSLTLHLKY